MHCVRNETCLLMHESVACVEESEEVKSGCWYRNKGSSPIIYFCLGFRFEKLSFLIVLCIQWVLYPVPLILVTHWSYPLMYKYLPVLTLVFLHYYESLRGNNILYLLCLPPLTNVAIWSLFASNTSLSTESISKALPLWATSFWNTSRETGVVQRSFRWGKWISYEKEHYSMAQLYAHWMQWSGMLGQWFPNHISKHMTATQNMLHEAAKWILLEE